jgi:trimeric autotransporter adhesin
LIQTRVHTSFGLPGDDTQTTQKLTTEHLTYWSLIMNLALPLLRGYRLLPLGVLLLGLGLLPPTLQAQLNGVYTIGPSGTYASFTQAVSALVSNGVSGPVTFNVQQGTYTQQVSIPAITGASSTNTITFDGGAGNASTRVLQYSTPNQADYVLKLDGADYFRFRNLTIRATGTTYGFGVLFTNQANYNHLIDCNIEVSTTSTNYYCIAVHAGNGTSYSTYGNWANHTLVEGCSIRGGGYYGIRFNGSSSSSTTLSVNNRFINNEVTGFNNYGMYFYYQPALQVNYNTIRPRASTSSSYGIYSYYANEGA